MSTSVAIGKEQENIACAFLEKQGLTLLKRNFRCALGEIDLIMEDHQDLVFVEVRYRKSAAYGHPLDTIDQRKQNRLKRTAEVFLQSHRSDQDCRFDIIAISSSGKDGIDWIQDAIFD